MEKWLPVKGYENYYEISNLGEVRSYDRLVTHWRGGWSLAKGRRLKLIYHKGYSTVHLSVNGVSKIKSVHRLLANTFIPNPTFLPVINHRDGNPKNNKIGNLEWCTLSHNVRHAYATGLIKKRFGEEWHSSKLKESQVREIKILLKKGEMKHYEIAKAFNISKATICLINRNKLWCNV